MAEKAKVLLVDDDPGHLKATSLFLEQAGYEVLTAEDGPAGLAAATEHKPDVIVLDVIMRRPDEGFALARALRAEPGLADTRLLVLTAAGQHYQMLFEPDEQWLPVEKVLEKPISGDALVAEVADLLAKRESNEG
jgi:CheY-like chemotaxis protein